MSLHLLGSGLFWQCSMIYFLNSHFNLTRWGSWGQESLHHDLKPHGVVLCVTSLPFCLCTLNLSTYFLDRMTCVSWNIG